MPPKKRRQVDWIICGKGATVCDEIILTGKELKRAKKRYKKWKKR